MRTETFSYLSQKVVSEFESSGWNDDKSAIYSTRYLGDMESTLKDMAPIEEEVQELVEEVHSKIKYY